MLAQSIYSLWDRLYGSLVATFLGANNEEMPAVDTTDPSPLLHNQRLAAYEWGAGEILLSPTAAFKKNDFFMKNAVAIGGGFIAASSKTDLLCLIAALHEYRHYQQDYLTGLGHWDYIERTKQTIGTISFAKYLSRDGTVFEPLESDACDIRESQASYHFYKKETSEIDQIGQYIVEELKQPREAANLLSTRRLLEMDAVLYTYLILTRSKANGRAIRNLKTVRNYFVFTEMEDVYGETIRFCYQNIRRLVIDNTPTDHLDNILHAVRILLTIAFAHPDPESLARLGHDPVHYIPGVRFFRMLLACIKQMQSDEHHPSPFEFEKAMIAKAGFSYPTFVECESGWANYFSNWKKGDVYSEVTEARREAIQEKYKNVFSDEERLARVYSDAITGESILAFSSYDLPLLLRRTDGQSHDSYFTNRSFRVRGYEVDRLRSVYGWRLSEFLLQRRKGFLCPFAQTSYCTAKVERCQRSYSDLRDVPASQKCRVRQTCFDKELGYVSL